MRVVYSVLRCTNICCITLKQFLSHVLIKRDLTVYLSKHLKDYFEDSNRQYAYCHTKTSVSNIVGYLNELQEHDHEESDTLLILHAVDTTTLNPLRECVVYYPVTDVFLLLIYNYSKLRQVLHFL